MKKTVIFEMNGDMPGYELDFIEDDMVRLMCRVSEKEAMGIGIPIRHLEKIGKALQEAANG